MGLSMSLSISHVQSRSLNCCNCGAALAAADVVCPHCHSRNAVDLMAIKQFRLLEGGCDDTCPNCKIPLTLVALDGFNCVVRHCTECKGLFLGPGVLDAILKRISHEVFEINHDRLDSIHQFLIKKDQVVYKPCPVCHAQMWRKPGIKGCSVVSDQCREHGVWLEAGELTVLAEWLEAGGQLKVEEDEKIAARVEAVAMPRPMPLPKEKTEDEEETEWNLSVEDMPSVAGFFAGALGFIFAIQLTNLAVALLMLGVTAFAAWLTKPWFAGASLGACVWLYWQTAVKWPPLLVFLVFVGVMGGLVAVYRVYLKQDE